MPEPGWDLPLGYTAKMPGCGVDARCRGGPLRGQAPTFPITIPLQTLFPDFPHPLPVLTIPHLCPISKEPCPGGCRCLGSPFPGPAALLPYGIGATHGGGGGGCPRFPGAWCSLRCLLCLPEAKGVLVCPPHTSPISWGETTQAPGVRTAGAGTRIPAAQSVRWEQEGFDPAAAHSVNLINRPRCVLGRKTSISYLLTADFSFP